MKLFYAFISFFISNYTWSQNDQISPFVISNDIVYETITQKFSFLFTDRKDISPKKIIEIQNQLTKNYSNFDRKKLSNLPKDLWTIGKIKNQTKDTLDLVFYTSNSQKATAYIVSDSNTIKKTIGYIQDSDIRYSKEVSNAFDFKLLPSQEKTIILHQEVYVDYELIQKFNICTQNTFNNFLVEIYRFYQGNRMFLGILSGGILLLFLYNLLMFLRTKAKNYLFYSSYLFFSFIFILLVLDRNQNFYLDKVMLYYYLIKEISFTLIFIFYGLFIKSILESKNEKINKLVKIYILLTPIYLFFLTVIYFKNTYNFDDFSLSLVALYKFISLSFVVIITFHLYKKNKVIPIKYIFIGSVILICSYLLQSVFEYFNYMTFFKKFSKLIVRTNLSILIGTLLQILFFSYALYIKTSKIIKDKITLENLSTIKSEFFANISHEFRTPLTLIKSPLQSLQSEIRDENQKSKLNLIDKNSDRMLNLVDQLLELSKIDSGKLQLILKEGNIGSFLHSIIESFEFKASENKVLFESSIEKQNQYHYFDKDIIEKIVTNLLSNAFKYTSQKEKINFTSTIENNHLKLVVSNTGSEIKKEELSKLFERFYQKKENQQGIGIGLSLVKELVELYKGKIESNLENGVLSFQISLPLEKSNNAIIVNREIQQPIIESSILDENELPILLIVDDNQDIRSVLKDIFNFNYIILEADNGESGLKLAQKEIPDCIISDVMMPKMDGFEFTKQIKNNELTSFIPIILLTAKTSDDIHIQGLQNAADAFLTKPFNNEIVKETVNQLITERKKLHQRYSQELVLRPVDIIINSFDEKFIEKLQVVLEKELSNADFSAENFAKSIGISRMQLHRKLKSLLGVSATEFLRNERLKIATELLKKENGTIAEIIYAVGFNDTSYFIRCFKEKYNCTPSEYQEKNK